MNQSKQKNYDIPKIPEPYWRDSVDIPTFPTLDKNIHDAEVGIVGGGITGITLAYLLVKQGIDVVLVDAGTLSNGVTGHTTAKITAQHGLIYDEFIQHFGLEKARMYYQANIEAMQLIKDIVSDHNIDCDLSKEDAYIYTNSDKYVNKISKEANAYDRIGIPRGFTDKLPFEIPVKSTLIMKNQAQFHPLKYLKVLINEIKDKAQIYENTTAVDIEYGNKNNILTRNGNRIRCKYIVSASHFPFHEGQGFFSARMYPERSYIIGVKTDKKFPGGMYINAEEPTRSIRSTTHNGDQLWLVVGENHKTGQGEPTYNHYEALEQFAYQTFGLQEYLYRWSAQDLTTLDKVPYVGPLTKDQPDILVATGYRKWGMTNGTAAAKMLCDFITKDEHHYLDLFAPSRFHADPDVKQFMKINSDVAKHLVHGKLEYTNNTVDDVQKGEGKIIRINGKKIGVYRNLSGEVTMVDTTCTHLGCEVEWNQGDRTWDCPCHGSRYKPTGEIVEGPAKRPLGKVDHSETR
ncbi:FAD-dependent oxidoreductase [Terrihalobacillus insolitus]|uniref:FAD-dependent oxidoreductase n=1 Tax=Terrihalobacillus insolitus TaxID=2950438 RepID=UPI002340217B|nr:FAD-dependent oxidoreductase [Terrihalobacillus insolitus]MDC3412970.1 FAD-dependent oxidoreductase [Terrihalobacillus insolitus]